MSLGFSSFQKEKTRELISYAKRFLGFDMRDKKPLSLFFEEGISELARGLNAIRYIYTTSSCGGHIKGDMSNGTPYVNSSPYVCGVVWVEYLTRFIQSIVNIMRENLLSTAELEISIPSRKRNYVYFCIKSRSIQSEKTLMNRRKELKRIAKVIGDNARRNPDPTWWSLLQTDK
jgi:hypothetical protein